MYHEEGLVLAVSSLPKPFKEEADLKAEQLPIFSEEPIALKVPNIAMKENTLPDLLAEPIPELPYYEETKIEIQITSPKTSSLSPPVEASEPSALQSEHEVKIPEVIIEPVTTTN
jgi:hypothetical protein